MSHNNSNEAIRARLQDALDGLRKDINRVEVWAGALSGFSQPVPEVAPAPSKFLLTRKDEQRKAV